MSVKGGAWLVGILLVIGTFVAAQFIMNATPATTQDKGGADVDRPPSYVICWGYFDAESGIYRALVPKQAGDIEDIVPENKKVKKGEVLMQINDKLVRIKRDQARAAVKAAEWQLQEAEKSLPALYKAQQDQQNAAIAAVQEEIKELETDRDSVLERLKSEPSYKKVAEKYGFGLTKLSQKKKAEEAKLRQIQVQDADLKIELAKADLKAKQLVVDEAEETLKNFQVRAPVDGFILRANVKKGEAYAPNPMGSPAFEFRPDTPIIVRAEILQEWGRYIVEPKDGKPGQLVEIEDDVYHGQKWEGRVKKLSPWYAQTRNPVIEPFRYNDVRTMECIIEVKDSKDAPVARIGQRVRAKIKI
jgi:multidrug resistance efflux pump